MTKYRDKLYDLLDQGLVDPRDFASQLISWLSEDDAKEFWHANEYDLTEDEDEEEGDLESSLDDLRKCLSEDFDVLPHKDGVEFIKKGVLEKFEPEN